MQMPMLRYTYIILWALLPLGGFAQEPVLAPADSVRQRPLLTHEILAAAAADTTALPDEACDVALPLDPARAPWALHEGLNAEVGMSVSASFGKNRRKGVGFGEYLTLAYAKPFGKDKRWMGAAGLYVSRADWGRWHQTEAGIAGMLGYRVNDWCNLYAYGAFNLAPGGQYGGCYPYGGYCGGVGGLWGGWDAYPYDPYARLRGKVGAAVEFKVGRNVAIGVAFEHGFYEDNRLPVPPAKPDLRHNPNHRGASEGGNHRGF